jgi:hypothetical protein
MRFSSLTFAALLAVPAGVLALNYSDATHNYTDASSFSRPEKAGISVLTNLGVVKGNDDGTFAPGRTLNRAEFAKIALMLNKSIEVISSDAADCFPDVRASDWFSKYVCLAKKRGIVKGYPDGKFHPEREVNYAESLKMLGELFGIIMDDSQMPKYTEWYVPYREGAIAAGVTLPGMDGRMEVLLTRGQMARLAAAYRAYMEGELLLYRQAEQGKTISSSSASSSKAQWATCPDGYRYQTVADDGSVINYIAEPCLTHQASSSSRSSSVSSASSSSVSSAQSSALYPAVKHLLTADAPSPPILDGTFTSQDEDGELRFVTVTLRREVKSLSGLTLIDGTGNEIGKLRLSLDDTNKRIWQGDFASGGIILRKGVPTTLGVRVTLKKDSVTSAELLETEDFRIQLLGKTSSISIHLVPGISHFPSHQAALSRIQSVKNAGEASGTLQAGSRRQIASFAFSGAVVTPGGTLRIEQLMFDLQSSGVALSSFKVGGTAEIQQADCGIDSATPQMLSCSLIPDAVNTVNGTRVIYVFANVAVLSGSALPSLQLSLQSPGSMNISGAVRWTDGAGRFNWMEGSAPLAVGTKWMVTK